MAFSQSLPTPLDFVHKQWGLKNLYQNKSRKAANRFPLPPLVLFRAPTTQETSGGVHFGSVFQMRQVRLRRAYDFLKVRELQVQSQARPLGTCLPGR